MFSPEDLYTLQTKGIGIDTIERQLEDFNNGFPPICLARVATTGDGILSFRPSEKKSLKSYFDQHEGKFRIMKFVPASGAATRMFKPLFEFHQQYRNSPIINIQKSKDQGYETVYTFLTHLEKFAFFDDLNEILKNEGKDLMNLRKNGRFQIIIDRLLFDKGLNYSMLPKALIKFHRYTDGSRVAMEEHLVEAAHYAKDEKNSAYLHFTLSPEHLKKFHEKVEEVRKKYEEKFNLCFEVSHSVQKPSTDTLAVDMNNIPLRNPDGTLLFRPAGHGALIENLNEINADIIFIKNIDNVVPDHLKESTVEYKKLLGGYLIKVRERIFKFLRNLELRSITDEETDEMADFAKEQLFICFPLEFKLFPLEKKLTLLKQKLNRPIRVCGMVKNEGEPGGGPFWVKDLKGFVSLQIVESSQISAEDENQKKVYGASTHFNPVDIVCSIKDWKGNTFDLSDYVDLSTGFISLKSSGGNNLKALELPGLWNGAMADWITIFIEVPVITFNPVKIINDLLRKEHQS